MQERIYYPLVVLNNLESDPPFNGNDGEIGVLQISSYNWDKICNLQINIPEIETCHELSLNNIDLSENRINFLINLLGSIKKLLFLTISSLQLNSNLLIQLIDEVRGVFFKLKGLRLGCDVIDKAGLKKINECLPDLKSLILNIPITSSMIINELVSLLQKENKLAHLEVSQLSVDNLSSLFNAINLKSSTNGGVFHLSIGSKTHSMNMKIQDCKSFYALLEKNKIASLSIINASWSVTEFIQLTSSLQKNTSLQDWIFFISAEIENIKDYVNSLFDKNKIFLKKVHTNFFEKKIEMQLSDYIIQLLIDHHTSILKAISSEKNTKLFEILKRNLLEHPSPAVYHQIFPLRQYLEQFNKISKTEAKELLERYVGIEDIYFKNLSIDKNLERYLQSSAAKMLRSVILDKSCFKLDKNIWISFLNLSHLEKLYFPNYMGVTDLSELSQVLLNINQKIILPNFCLYNCNDSALLNVDSFLQEISDEQISLFLNWQHDSICYYWVNDKKDGILETKVKSLRYRLLRLYYNNAILYKQNQEIGMKKIILSNYYIKLSARLGHQAAKNISANYFRVIPKHCNQYWTETGAKDAYITFQQTDLIEINEAELEPNFLGAGTFASVYATSLSDSAAHLSGFRALALKVLPLPRAGAEIIRTEIDILKRIHSPWIVGFYGSFEFGRHLYLILELAMCSLDKIITAELPTNYVLQLLLEVTEGVLVLHKNRIIHRDLKPHNILIGQDLHARVADFDVAKIHQTLRNSGSSQSRSTGGLVGTANYMAPEAFDDEIQLTEEEQKKSDVYALGLIAYSLAKREMLYADKSDAKIMGIRLKGQERIELAKKLTDSLPLFNTILEKSCMHISADRWTTQEAKIEIEAGAFQNPVNNQDITEALEKVKETISPSHSSIYSNFFY